MKCRKTLKGFIPERKERIHSFDFSNQYEKHLKGSNNVNYLLRWLL